MPETSQQEAEDYQGVSRRDFLKFFSLMIGGLALPRAYLSALEPALAAPNHTSFIPQPYFQWQNEFLCKTIYPMREAKLRDFLIYYMEVDIWSQYKDKDINALTNEVNAYKKAWEANAIAALKEYTSLRDYFLKEDVREDYSEFRPIDEAELTEINRFHALFVDSWPKDIRGERSFVEGIIPYWARHRNGIRDWINSRTRRHAAMNPGHPKYIPEGEELRFKESVTLPMAEQEMDQLRTFLATYDKIEERKLAWYRLSKSDPNFKTPEAEYLAKYPPDLQVTIGDIARWKVEEYTKSIAKKNQYELLDMINQRFQKEPQRFPQWLQYMLVHFSGMRYASAHYSWADPGDLLVRLQAPKIEAEIKILDDATVEKLCQEKVAAYETPAGAAQPKLARAQEKEWRDKIGWYLPNCKSNSAGARRQGLTDLRKAEDAYEIWSKSTQDVLETLRSMQASFPSWAWKEIVKFTPLRVTEVSDPDWERLTPQEVEDRNAQQSSAMRAIMDAWEYLDPSAWREEHGRTLELIVSRLVCNEAAEHCQHVRGQLPPGGLAARPKWYLDAEGKTPGAYFVRPTSEKDYTQGASILWLRFVNFSAMTPSEWQIAKPVETKQKVGLLPAEVKTKKKARDGGWVYKLGQVITRSRTTITTDKQRVVENQWLRWIHEATVAEVAETAEGMMVLTFETSLPGGDNATSAVGMHKTPLRWHLSDGTEDGYNRSFVGYLPEGQAPVEHLKTMLDWDKIFSR
ncbi:MAG: hypothetical protein JW963_01425 [Anaerolineales bacterium]|nr:hypothetical protein [Anaerolineales bacterium]